MWLHSKTLKSSRILGKCSVFPRSEYVSMDRPEICEVARRIIDNVCVRKQQLYEHLFKVELEADRLLFIPLVPTPLVDEELGTKSLYNALAFALYPYFYGFSSRWGYIATRNKDYSTRRALALRFRGVVPQRLYFFDDYPKQQPE